MRFALAAFVLILDRWTKWLIETRFTAWDTKVVIPGFFNLVHSENPGIAFSIFAEGASKGRTLALVCVTVVAVVALGWMLYKAQDRISRTALALITGGALGNLYDRIHAGAATDFLDFYAGRYHWYTFNLADSAICIGAGLLILTMLGNQKAT
jgi:signal peptidase II